MPVFRTDTKDAVEATRSGLERAREAGLDTVIVDTAGRLQIDDELMHELERVRDEVKPHERPARRRRDDRPGRGQRRRGVPRARRVDGVILTKLDGDARGGAALVRQGDHRRADQVRGTGEKLDALEEFHPDRMASRILGMGDVLTLIERAEAAVEEDEQAEMERRLQRRPVHASTTS